MPRKRLERVTDADTPHEARLRARAVALIALDELESALKAGRAASTELAAVILRGLVAWREAAGTLSLEDALGLRLPGLRHPMEEAARARRDHAYLVELARLIAIGFEPKEADVAVADRFANDWPWGLPNRKIRALKRDSVAALRKQYLDVAACIPGEQPVQLYGHYAEEAAALSPEERAAYLANYPGDSLPNRFR